MQPSKKRTWRIFKLIGFKKSQITKESKKATALIATYQAEKRDNSGLTYNSAQDALKSLGIAWERGTELEGIVELHTQYVLLLCDLESPVDKEATDAKIKNNEEELAMYLKRVLDFDTTENESLRNMSRETPNVIVS